MIDQKTVAPRAQRYTLRTALLSEGRTHRILASTQADGRAMNVAVKCYAEGGENEFHTHAREDHTFVVLQGRAIFHQPDGPDLEVGTHEGILLPAGAFYKFEAVPGEPLVLLRVGNSYASVESRGLEPEDDDRLGIDGLPLPSNSKENKHVKGVPIPGAFFE